VKFEINFFSREGLLAKLRPDGRASYRFAYQSLNSELFAPLFPKVDLAPPFQKVDKVDKMHG
jgi:hypothetical protein